MWSFLVPLISSLFFAILTLLFLVISLLKESKNGIYEILATICSAFITLISVFNITVPVPSIYPLDSETRLCIDDTKITIRSDAKYFVKTYYSLDGSDPKDGNIYCEPIIISESTTICARSKFLCWWSEMDKKSYFFSDMTESQELIDIQNEINRIQNMYYSISNLKNILEPNSEHPVIRYYTPDNMVVIKVFSGYDDIEYSRIYFYDSNWKLYFAFVYFENEKENRLYFKDDTLIRYINERGQTYDLYDSFVTCEWEEFVLKESYELLGDASRQ